MSIQLYNRPLVNGSSGLESSIKYGHFILKLAVLRAGNRKTKTTEVEFGLSGPAATTRDEMLNAAVITAGKIAKLSDGVVMGFYEKLGKYRNDELPKTVAENKKFYATMILSNNPRVEDANAEGPLPLHSGSMKLFIPWLGSSTSRQDMVATVSEPAPGFQFAQSRFVDADKTTIEVMPLNYVAGVTTKEYSKAPTFELQNNDTVSGASDHVLSELNDVIIHGKDDQE